VAELQINVPARELQHCCLVHGKAPQLNPFQMQAQDRMRAQARCSGDRCMSTGGGGWRGLPVGDRPSSSTENEQMRSMPITAFIAYAMTVATLPAAAHETTTGWQYDQFCCNGDSHSGDCQMISTKNVKITENGYESPFRPAITGW
jgi:hypothetical protein